MVNNVFRFVADRLSGFINTLHEDFMRGRVVAGARYVRFLESVLQLCGTAFDAGKGCWGCVGVDSHVRAFLCIYLGSRNSPGCETGKLQLGARLNVDPLCAGVFIRFPSVFIWAHDPLGQLLGVSMWRRNAFLRRRRKRWQRANNIKRAPRSGRMFWAISLFL